ncbi:hypothetical protein PN36_14625 [Candidatus Thiomargarita nelsonii]|uniref:Uncharacterized protein n=1 Tax=Candidatus Thiomargarita nelsonii TaxID=1003181 RepID=A0A0A6PEA4_9GAMM|nr:hypothetical protein PN36_14625 [Candidatus Thiomargarita nelsonii]
MVALNGDSFLKDLDEMQTMTTATLDFMRGLENTESVQPLDIRALVESLQADYEDMGLSVTLEGDTPPPYPARPQSLKRCLVNLIDNDDFITSQQNSQSRMTASL